MTEEQKLSILDSAKAYFRETIIPGHIKKITKLRLKDFKINPFTIEYTAAFLCGNTKPESIAKALIYPQILGTSISTTFGKKAQLFIAKVSEISGQGSGIKGIDIEFWDAVDKRKKYCQCKAGPRTINADDVVTIKGHFRDLTNKALTDGLPLQLNDLIIGVLYGTKKDLSSNYKKLAEDYPVFCGSDFWMHLTGDSEFYYRLAKSFDEVVEEDKINGSKLIKDAITRIAKEIEKKGII